MEPPLIKIDGQFYRPIDLRYGGIVRRRSAADSVHVSTRLFGHCPSPAPTNRLEMEVEAGRNHMAVVVEAFIFDVLVSRIDAF